MTSELLQLVLAAILVAVAMLLVMAETAIGRVSRSQIEDVVREDAKRADRLLAVIHDRARYVNVLLFLSTIATVTATVLVGYVSVDRLVVQSDGSPALAMLVAVAVMVTVSYVVLGVAARTLGRQHAERIALAAAGPVRFLATILGPVTTLLIVVGNAVTPGKGYREGPFASQAELREMVDLAEADDLIEDDERQMIHSVFELGDTFAREVMVPRTEMVFIERTKTLRQALFLGLRSGFSRIPVIGENSDDIVGIVYLKDIVRRSFEHRDAEENERVESLMRAPYFVPDSKPADALLREMQSARVHMAVVVDEYGGTAGLVTIEDILEEIVGEIADEYDTAAPEVTELPGGMFRVLARMHVDDFADLIGVSVGSEDEGVDTVLGLVAKRLGRVPIPGASVREGSWLLTAEQGAGRRNRIGTVLAQPVDDLSDDEDAVDD
ncbi:MAG: magnesium and cobalt exporter, family [Actinomycetota bacterium]|jgi:CBS domain containing-hemolysin-like protein|nr:magnesium and cobalt exporter, family [Actinomycetota bacterium]